MKTTVLICVLCLLLGGCARKSDLDKTRAELAEAQRKIEQLERERVPRAQYDIARASLRISDERINTLEKNLNAAYDLMAEQQINLPPKLASTAPTQPAATPPPPSNFRLTNGGYVVSNDTHVYSADSELELGQHLKVSSPTGLMVTDTEQRIVGGDLAIKDKAGLTMTVDDGLLTANADGTVEFTGTNLTMKFDEKKEQPNQSTETTSQLQPTTDPAPAPTPSSPDTASTSSTPQ